MKTAIEQELQSRLERLERSARRWRMGTLGSGLALLGALLPAAMTPEAVTTAPRTSGPSAGSPPGVVEELRAQRVVLVDDEGTEVGALELDSKGFPQLMLRRAQRVGLLTLSEPGFLIRDGRRGAYLGLNSSGASVLELTGDNLIQGARVTVQKDGSTGYYVLDEQGRRRTGVEWLSSGHAQFSAYDATGTLRVQEGVDPKGNANNALFDGEGVPRLGLVVPTEGVPIFAAQDSLGRLRAQLIQALDGSTSMEFHNELGDVFWRKPD